MKESKKLSFENAVQAMSPQSSGSYSLCANAEYAEWPNRTVWSHRNVSTKNMKLQTDGFTAW